MKKRRYGIDFIIDFITKNRDLQQLKLYKKELSQMYLCATGDDIDEILNKKSVKRL